MKRSKNLVAIVLSIQDISKDSFKKSNRLYHLKSMFSLHCSRKHVVNSIKENFALIRNALQNKSGNTESLKNNHSSCKAL